MNNQKYVVVLAALVAAVSINGCQSRKILPNPAGTSSYPTISSTKSSNSASSADSTTSGNNTVVSDTLAVPETQALPAAEAAPDAQTNTPKTKIDAGLYGDILKRYRQAISQRYNRGELLKANLNGLCTYCYEGDPLANIGFKITDVDGNGALELLIGSVGANMTVDKMIFEMYTISNNEPTLVFSGWERSRYYLNSDDSFGHWGSSGSRTSIKSISKLNQTGNLLIQAEAVIYDFAPGRTATWFFATDDDWDVSDDIQITKAAAQKKIQNYTDMRIQVNLTPFSEYE